VSDFTTDLESRSTKRRLSMRDGARRADCSPRHFYNLAYRGEIPTYIALGKRWVDEEDIDAYFARCKAAGPRFQRPQASAQPAGRANPSLRQRTPSSDRDGRGKATRRATANRRLHLRPEKMSVEFRRHVAGHRAEKGRCYVCNGPLITIEQLGMIVLPDDRRGGKDGALACHACARLPREALIEAFHRNGRQVNLTPADVERAKNIALARVKAATETRQ
jgi:predicted DNA-binding transcriptional regulator AlpA